MDACTVVLSVGGDPAEGGRVSEAEAFRSLAFAVGVAASAPIVLVLPMFAVTLHRAEPAEAG